MANPATPADVVAGVRVALTGMLKDPEGIKVLEAGAELLKSAGDLGFVTANDRDYDNYRRFYRTTRVK
jgi:phosphonate transport system substrate-binding protein